MPQLFIKEITGQWTYIKDVSDIGEAERWARDKFRDYSDGILKRTITGVVVQGNMIYVYYDIVVKKDGNKFGTKVTLKIKEREDGA